MKKQPEKKLDHFIMIVFISCLFMICLIPLVVLLIQGSNNQSALNYNLERVHDLRQLSQDINNYYQTTGTLPYTLRDLPPQIYFYDPQTGKIYSYYPYADTEYSLCYAKTDNPNDYYPDSFVGVIFLPFNVFDRHHYTTQCTYYSVATPTTEYRSN